MIAAGVLALCRVPIYQPDIYVLITCFDLCLEGIDVAEAILTAIVVRIDRFWFEGEDGVGRFVDVHGIGQVHTDEGHIDVGEGPHFGDALGIAGDIEVLAADAEDIAVAPTLCVHGGGAFGEVIHGQGGDVDACFGGLVAVVEDDEVAFEGIGQFIGDGFGCYQDGGGLPYGGDGFGVEVIAVDVGDEDEIRLFDARVVVSAAGGVDIDKEFGGFQDEAGVDDGLDEDGSVGGRDPIGRCTLGDGGGQGEKGQEG